MKSRLCLLSILILMSCSGYQINGIIGARATSNIVDEDNELSASYYVQDGLIAIWDGIENAGYGLHDDDPTYWVDLTGGGADWRLKDQYSGQSFYCGTDYVEITDGVTWPRDRRGHCNPSWESEDDIISLEIVIDTSNCDITSSGNKQIVTFGGGSSGLGNGQWLHSLYLSENYLCCRGAYYPKIPLLNGINYISLEFGEKNVLLNGEVVETTKATVGNYSYCGPVISVYSGTVPIGAKIKCMRIYGKMLSISEMLHNYVIDKQRFRQ